MDNKDFEYYDSIRAKFSRSSGGNGCGPSGLAYQAAYNDGNEEVAKYFLQRYIKEHGKEVEYGVHLYPMYLLEQISCEHKKSNRIEFGKTIKLFKQDQYEENWETAFEKVTYIRSIKEEETRNIRTIVEEFRRVVKKK